MIISALAAMESFSIIMDDRPLFGLCIIFQKHDINQDEDIRFHDDGIQKINRNLIHLVSLLQSCPPTRNGGNDETKDEPPETDQKICHHFIYTLFLAGSAPSSLPIFCNHPTDTTPI